MSANYVEARDGNLYVGKSRVTLETIILKWQMGDSPEEIHKGFPSVPLAAIYGTIAYYLEHQEELDRFLRENEELAQAQRAAAEAANPEFYARMRQRFAEARKRLGLEEPEAGHPVNDSSAEKTLESSV
ncbi:MAG TPA: DUF433 domain-containing protein [Ktedonobacterales bacterium]|nr:DUF433 domain-containing protein [Ktedonobacterales bacterium]